MSDVPGYNYDGYEYLVKLDSGREVAVEMAGVESVVGEGKALEDAPELS